MTNLHCQVYAHNQGPREGMEEGNQINKQKPSIAENTPSNLQILS